MSYKTEFPLVKHIFDTDERLMIVLFFTGSIGESACVREHSSSWGAVIGQGNKVDKRISHKQKHKFQVKGEKKGSVPCCTNACCMSLYVSTKNHLISKSTNAGKTQSRGNVNVLELFSQKMIPVIRTQHVTISTLLAEV